jgi:methionine-rich copper-binding protein CopC
VNTNGNGGCFEHDPAGIHHQYAAKIFTREEQVGAWLESVLRATSSLTRRYRDGGKPRIAAGRPVKVNSGKIQMRQVLGLALASLLFAGAAQARPMQVLQTTPADNATIDSLNMQFVVRFDGDVDHRASRLYVTSGENVVEELHPSLSAAPRVLFANSPRLPAGSYELHWDGKFLPDGDITSGSLHFRVK